MSSGTSSDERQQGGERAPSLGWQPVQRWLSCPAREVSARGSVPTAPRDSSSAGLGAPRGGVGPGQGTRSPP